MENVLATKNDRSLIAETTDHTDTTVVICRVVFVELKVDELLVVRLDAVLVQAGQAAPLTTEAKTLVPAWVHLVATSLHFLNAFGLTADISKRWIVTDGLLLERLPAVAALEGDSVVLGLLAAHADVVRLFLATGAEVLGAR